MSDLIVLSDLYNETSLNFQREASKLTDMGAIPDSDLVNLMRTGSKAALEEIYHRYFPAIWRYVYMQLQGNQNTSEDIVSEIFLAVVSKLNKMDPERITLKAWLMGIARHKVADHWRHNKRMQTLKENVSQQKLFDTQKNSLQQKSLKADECRLIVVKVMGKLKDSDRQVLEWKYLDNLSVRRIAKFMGKTEKAIENLLYRARQNFHSTYRSLQKSEPEEYSHESKT